MIDVKLDPLFKQIAMSNYRSGNNMRIYPDSKGFTIMIRMQQPENKLRFMKPSKDTQSVKVFVVNNQTSNKQMADRIAMLEP